MIMPTIKNLEMICGFTDASELLSFMNNKNKNDIDDDSDNNILNMVFCPKRQQRS